MKLVFQVHFGKNFFEHFNFYLLDIMPLANGNGIPFDIMPLANGNGIPFDIPLSVFYKLHTYLLV